MTYKEYMAYDDDSTNETRAAKHHAYYMQFADAMHYECKSFCLQHGYTPDYIRPKLAEDRHLNNLRIGWMNVMDGWTLAYKLNICRLNKQLSGDHAYSLSDGVCILKAYMRDSAKE
jgi:hypothetical protein